MLSPYDICFYGYEPQQYDDSNENGDVNAENTNFENRRKESAERLENEFERIFAKYSKDFTDTGDVINLLTGEIEVDNGHLEHMECRVFGNVAKSFQLSLEEEKSATENYRQTVKLRNFDIIVESENLEVCKDMSLREEHLKQRNRFTKEDSHLIRQTGPLQKETPKKRNRFTEEDDCLLRRTIRDAQNKKMNLYSKDGKIWKTLAEENPHHPHNSWRYRAQILIARQNQNNIKDVNRLT